MIRKVLLFHYSYLMRVQLYKVSLLIFVLCSSGYDFMKILYYKECEGECGQRSSSKDPQTSIDPLAEQVAIV